MSYTKSLLDTIIEKIAPVARAVHDVKTEIHGTKTNVLRIARVSKSEEGDIDYQYQSQVINNVIMRYPFTSIELFGTRDGATNDTKAIDIFDILPITMITSFSGDASQQAVEIDDNDIVVDVLFDDHNLAIPIVMRVNREYGTFMGNKRLVNKKYELTLVRGSEAADIQPYIDSYISGIAG
jgi:hypothetical protein